MCEGSSIFVLCTFAAACCARVTEITCDAMRAAGEDCVAFFVVTLNGGDIGVIVVVAIIVVVVAIIVLVVVVILVTINIAVIVAVAL